MLISTLSSADVMTDLLINVPKLKLWAVPVIKGTEDLELE